MHDGLAARINNLNEAIVSLVKAGELYEARELSDLVSNRISEILNHRFFVAHHDVTDAVKLFTEGDNKVAAIKELRRITGMGLKDSKDYIESNEVTNEYTRIKMAKKGY